MPSSGVTPPTNSISRQTATTSKEAAAASAGHDVLLSLYPGPESRPRCHAGQRRWPASRRASPRRRASHSARKPQPKSSPCAPMTASTRGKLSAPYEPGRLCADRHGGQLHGRRDHAVGDDQRLAIPSRPAADAQFRDLDTRSQRDSRAGRAQQHPAHGRADDDRPVLVSDRRAHLQSRSSTRWRRPRTWTSSTCARLFALVSMAGIDALHRRVRCEVCLQFLASGDGDPQRRSDRQHGDAARCVVAAAWRHADASGIPMRALHYLGCRLGRSSAGGGRGMSAKSR